MSDKKIFKFVGTTKDNIIPYDNNLELIESRGYKKAVKSFQNKYPKIKEVMVNWIKEGVNLSKLQKLPIGRKKKQ